jgi:hypothetical protein
VNSQFCHRLFSSPETALSPFFDDVRAYFA